MSPRATGILAMVVGVVLSARARRILRRWAVLRFCVAPLLIGWAVAAMVLDKSVWPGAIVLFFGVWELLYGAYLLWSIAHPPKDNFWTP